MSVNCPLRAFFRCHYLLLIVVFTERFSYVRRPAVMRRQQRAAAAAARVMAVRWQNACAVPAAAAAMRSARFRDTCVVVPRVPAAKNGEYPEACAAVRAQRARAPACVRVHGTGHAGTMNHIRYSAV